MPDTQITTPQTLTVGDVLYQAYRYAGILHGPMRGLSGSEQQEGVMLLNAMLDALKADRAFIPAVGRLVFPINANQQAYVIGTDTSGGVPDWLIDRPEVLVNAGFLFTNVNPVIEIPFEVYTLQQWEALSPKELTSTIPYVCYYRAWGGHGQNGVVYLWPVPVQSWAIALYLWVNLSLVTGPDQVLQIPPAYNDVLSYGLAVRLAALYPKMLNPLALGEIKQQAAAAKQRIRAINFPNLMMQAELASLGVRTDSNFGSRYCPLSNSYIR